MVLVKECNFNSFIDETLTYNGNLQTGPSLKESKTTGLFEFIYSYPPKLKLRWNALDECQEDLCLSSNYSVLEHSFPFIDFIQDWLFYSEKGEVEPTGYSIDDFINGYLDKNHSSNFYKNKTKDIQATLAQVPVFVILNGHKEIVLSKTNNALKPKNTQTFIDQTVYETCGAFDSDVEKQQQLGFFFMSRDDAEIYLQEVAKSDIDGTKTVGLSIHCVGLDAAYRVVREHHPGIDFRFIPNFKEIKGLLQKDIFKKNFIVEDTQHQLRFRPRSQNIFPAFGKLGQKISPNVSFLQRNEYFKGVPIYIVQLNKEQHGFALSQYFNIISPVDTGLANVTQALDKVIGFGHNWIMQGSLYDAGRSDKFSNYIFFEREAAKTFIKTNRRKVAHYKGSRVSNMESIVRKPKIYVYNFEDFLELWEEKIQADLSQQSDNYRETILAAEKTSFITPTNSGVEFSHINDQGEFRLFQNVQTALNLKYRVFKNFIGIFFSVGYS